MSSSLLLSFMPGCWANPGAADRHGGERGHSGCHPRGERRGGPDRHLRGHLRVSHTTVLCSVARGDSLEQNANSLTSSRVWKSLYDNKLKVTDEIQGSRIFQFLCFPLQLAYFIANQMSQCGNVHRELERDYDTPKSTVVVLVFSSPEGPGPPQNTQGLVSVQGGCCLCRPSSCHFISTHACLHRLWKIVELSGVKTLG